MEDGKKAATMSAEKQKALAAALAQIEKQFGKGSIMKMGDAEVEPDTGEQALEIADALVR